MERPQIYSCEEAAKRVKLDTSQVRNLARQFDIGAKIGTVWVFTPADLQKLRDRPPMGRPPLEPVGKKKSKGKKKKKRPRR